MLEAAGYKIGKDKIRAKETENGPVKLAFEILYFSSQFERWFQPFVKNLERIGVKATLRLVDASQYQNRVNAFDYDMILHTFGQSESPVTSNAIIGDRRRPI